MNPQLTSAQTDRAAGVLGTACGDALGAGYEFGPPLSSTSAVAMIGGGSFGWAPGEWTDDTSMAIAIAEVTADGGPQPSATMLAEAASTHHAREGQSGANGSLMRTAPVALAFLHDPGKLAYAARAVSALTHYDRQAGEACALWCLAMRRAVLHGTFDGLRLAVLSLPADRTEVWTARLDEAELHPPSISTATGGWSRRCRPPGRPSAGPPSRATPRMAGRLRPSTSSSPWRRRSAADAIRTRSRRSPAAWSAPGGVPRRRWRGSASCTAGRACAAGA
jgi:hypothetical protein